MRCKSFAHPGLASKEVFASYRNYCTYQSVPTQSFFEGNLELTCIFAPQVCYSGISLLAPGKMTSCQIVFLEFLGEHP